MKRWWTIYCNHARGIIEYESETYGGNATELYDTQDAAYNALGMAKFESMDAGVVEISVVAVSLKKETR
jgi:hypothetical protein